MPAEKLIRDAAHAIVTKIACLKEFGIGLNYGMLRTGYRIYDEKAIGTVHIAIGNNVHLAGKQGINTLGFCPIQSHCGG